MYLWKEPNRRRRTHCRIAFSNASYQTMHTLSSVIRTLAFESADGGSAGSAINRTTINRTRISSNEEPLETPPGDSMYQKSPSGNKEDQDDDDDQEQSVCTVRQVGQTVMVLSESSQQASSWDRRIRFYRDSFLISSKNACSDERSIDVELHPLFVWRLVALERLDGRTHPIIGERNFVRLRAIVSSFMIPPIVKTPIATHTCFLFRFSEQRTTFHWNNVCYCDLPISEQSNDGYGRNIAESPYDMAATSVRRLVGLLHRKSDPTQHIKDLMRMCVDCLYMVRTVPDL